MHDEFAGAIEEAIARLRGELVDMLRELVRIPSITGNEGAAQEFMCRQYEAVHLKNIRLIAQREKIENHPAFCGANKAYDDRPNIIGIWRGIPGRSPLFSTDTSIRFRLNRLSSGNIRLSAERWREIGCMVEAPWT